MRHRGPERAGRPRGRLNRFAALVPGALLAMPAAAAGECLDPAADPLAECRLERALTIVSDCLEREPATTEVGEACGIRAEAYRKIEAWSRVAVEPPCRVPERFYPDVPGLDAEMARALLSIHCGMPGRRCAAQLRDASERYDAGRFDEIPAILEPCVTFRADSWADRHCDDEYRTPPDRESAARAYELLAKTFIATNQTERAEAAVRRLVFLDPDFTPRGPFLPQPLVEMVAAARRGRATLAGLGIERCGDEVALGEVCDRIAEQCADDVVYGPWEIGVLAGFFVPDEDLSGKTADLGQAEPMAGVRVAYLLRSRWALFADVVYWDINTDNPPSPGLPPGTPDAPEDSETLVLRTGAEWWTAATGRRLPRQWFVAFGVGWARFDLQFPPPGDPVDPVERVLASVGAGQRFLLEPHGRARIRWEARVDRMLGSEGFGSAEITQVQLLLGLNWMVGRL